MGQPSDGSPFPDLSLFRWVAHSTDTATVIFFIHVRGFKKSSKLKKEKERFRGTCCCAPLAVPLDGEVPVARGFRRLHAPGARGDTKADRVLPLPCLGFRETPK